MAFIRRVMCWMFAVTALLYLLYFFRVVDYLALHHSTSSMVRTLLFSAAFSLVVSAICGVAWSALWNEWPSAQRWAIGASLIHLVIFFRQFTIAAPPVWGRHVGALFIGIVGLVVFSQRAEELHPQASTDLGN